MRRILSVLAASIALIGGGAVVAAPAHAVTCSYNTCYNVDPVAAGCGADAYTIYHYNVNKEVRYSPACKAAWVRSNTGEHILGHGTDTVMRTYSSVQGTTLISQLSWGKGDKKISNMIPMMPYQFIQLTLAGWETTPMLNTVRV